ncbi:hypothetical protein DPMN_150224 [Dreissena polymorpha]|uniref:Uncharacterized protein n=1 Tax=Dreissena polymorpha TaxID=45954 RepID=A0A9D4J356_DREPO|nr:hypothetical protein DPMN_150224 [Dreissena polymorpha]
MFHKDWTINVTCIVLTRKTAVHPGGHIFQQTGTIFKLSLAIIRTKVLTKVLTSKTARPLAATFFQQTGTILNLNWTKNKTSRENCNSPGGHVFQQTGTIFKLSLDIIRTYLVTKFQCKQGFTITIYENCWSPGDHVFQLTRTIFELS